MESYPLEEARNQLGQLVDRVRHDHEHILITEYGKPVAALIPVGELEEFRRMRDGVDLTEARTRANAPDARWISHDDVMRVLDEDDRKAAE